MADHKDWVAKHHSPRAQMLVETIKSLEGQIASAKRDLEKEEEKLWLLDGDGENLEALVKKFFVALGCTIEPPKKDAPFSFVAKDPHMGHQLTVKVLATEGKFDKDSKALGELLGYVPDYFDHNANGPVEHICVVVNTFKDQPTDKRSKDDIGQAVLKVAKANQFALARTTDLHLLWGDLDSNGRKPLEIFDTLFASNGVVEYKLPKV
ncbi:MAG: hypothetical protein ACREJQ_04640 [bacterium]